MTEEKDNRCRSWACIVYPESLNPDWIEKIRQSHIEICVSPLHNKDLNPNGEKKKEHYHVVFKFGSKKSEEQMRELWHDLFGTGFAEGIKLSNIKGYVRYLIHKDNPEKAQYDELQIQSFNGFDCSEYLKSSKNDRYLIMLDIINYVEANDVKEFKTLINYCKDENFEWFKILCDSSVFIREYINSNRNSSRSKNLDNEFNELNKKIEIMKVCNNLK